MKIPRQTRAVFFALALAACAAEPLQTEPAERQSAAGHGKYSVYSHDVGWDAVDMRITEVRREDQVSVFHIPGYAGRTATGSRFSMCAFSQFALLNGFSHWAVSADDQGSEYVRVGFFVEALQDPEDLFESSFLGESYPSAAMVAPICKFFDRYSGELLSTGDPSGGTLTRI